MKIGIIGSMHFTEKMLEARDALRVMGHNAFCTSLAEPYVGLDEDAKQHRKIEDQLERDAIREFWRLMQGGDAVLVMNLERNGIPNYIGGNTFLEIGFAHVLNQKIFFWNPIPEIPLIRPELEAMRPVVINGDLTMIR